MNLSCSPAVIDSRADVNSPRNVHIIQPYGSLQTRDLHHRVFDHDLLQRIINQEANLRQLSPDVHSDNTQRVVDILRHERLSPSHQDATTSVPRSIGQPGILRHQRLSRDDSQPDPEDTWDGLIQFGDEAPLLGDENDPDKEQDSKVQRSGISIERIRLIRTASMLLFYICLGLNAGIMSPATLDLMELYSCNIAQISMVFMVKSLGLLLGSFFGGAISNRLRRRVDVILSVIIMVFGLTNAAIPWCTSPASAAVLMGLIGIMHGTINVVCSSVTIAEWGEDSPSPVNALHFALTLGMLLAPATTAPFLSERNDNLTLNAMMDDLPANLSNIMMNNLSFVNDLPICNLHKTADDCVDDELVHNGTFAKSSQIFIPFAFHGALGICTGLLFMAYHCVGWEYQTAKKRTVTFVTSSGENTRNENTFKILMGISLFLIYIFIVNSNNSINVFIFYIAVESSIRMPKRRAAMFNTVYNVSWVIGRLLGTLNARCIKIHYIVFFSILAVLVNTISLVFIGLESELTFWLLTCAMGIFSGPCYPSVMAWADRYIEMEGVMVAVADIGIGMGGFISLYLGGYLLHTLGATYVFMLSAAASGLLLIIMVILQIYCHIRGDRYKRQLSALYATSQVTQSGESDE